MGFQGPSGVPLMLHCKLFILPSTAMDTGVIGQGALASHTGIILHCLSSGVSAMSLRVWKHCGNTSQVPCLEVLDKHISLPVICVMPESRGDSVSHPFFQDPSQTQNRTGVQEIYVV